MRRVAVVVRGAAVLLCMTCLGACKESRTASTPSTSSPAAPSPPSPPPAPASGYQLSGVVYEYAGQRRVPRSQGHVRYLRSIVAGRRGARYGPDRRRRPVRYFKSAPWTSRQAECSRSGHSESALRGARQNRFRHCSRYRTRSTRRAQHNSSFTDFVRHRFHDDGRGAAPPRRGRGRIVLR